MSGCGAVKDGAEAANWLTASRARGKTPFKGIGFLFFNGSFDFDQVKWDAERLTFQISLQFLDRR